MDTTSRAMLKTDLVGLMLKQSTPFKFIFILEWGFTLFDSLTWYSRVLEYAISVVNTIASHEKLWCSSVRRAILAKLLRIHLLSNQNSVRSQFLMRSFTERSQ